ncbi:hypothetical protein F0562_003870 [Nyssa sinensis]|uniref:TF-B3 domain-containing protein n=1 Tax=Nyssa sinensis TaxID=561372 RepID=A0A5J5BXC8_9ASTE|nr:hypothetical protein F0562_003870 [Nyssa sinensis]
MWENLTLQTHTGESWGVKIEQLGGHDYFTHYGWQKFVQDHKLEVGDFLVFCLISDSIFEVVMYDRSGCEKEVNPPIWSNIGDASAISERNNENPLMGFRRTACRRKSKASLSDAYVKRSGALHGKTEADESEGKVEAAGSVKAIQPSFVGVLKKYNRCYMIVPRHFERETGIRRKKSMVLRNPEGREWPVVIRVWKWRSRVVLGNGWSEFRRANKLAYGDTCLFQFIQSAGNVIQVQRGGMPTRNRYRLRS